MDEKVLVEVNTKQIGRVCHYYGELTESELPVHKGQETAEKNQEVWQYREKLKGYYETNRKRMRYRTFIDAGYMTGSGAVESAHRTVIQQRLKLSGQRWTTPGEQQVLSLRVAKYSNYWDKVRDLTRNAA